MDFPLELIPPPAGLNVHWNEIRRYRPNPNDVLNNIMSDEVSSSCSPRRSAEIHPPLPPDDAAVPNISANNAHNNGNGAGNVPDDTVGSSGIDEDMERQQNHRSVPQRRRRPANQQARATIERRFGRHIVRCRHDKTKIKVMKLIARSPGGILCRDLFKKYRKRYGVPLKYNSLDYKTPMKLIQAMKLKIIISRPHSETAREGDLLLTMAPPEVRGPVDLTGIVRLMARPIFENAD